MLKYPAAGRIFKPMTIKITSQKGQGLIETVITVLIIASVIIALIRFQTNLTYGNSVSQQQNTAMILALNKTEILRDFTVLSGTNSYQSIATGSSTYNGASATYTIAWTITSFTNPTYKTIDVKVTWTDRDGVGQSTRFITKVAGIDPSYSSSIMG